MKNVTDNRSPPWSHKVKVRMTTTLNVIAGDNSGQNKPNCLEAHIVAKSMENYFGLMAFTALLVDFTDGILPVTHTK